MNKMYKYLLVTEFISSKNTKANRKILLVFVEGTKDDAILWIDLKKQVITAALYKTATFIISSMPFLGQKNVFICKR